MYKTPETDEADDNESFKDNNYKTRQIIEKEARQENFERDEWNTFEQASQQLRENYLSRADELIDDIRVLEEQHERTFTDLNAERAKLSFAKSSLEDLFFEAVSEELDEKMSPTLQQMWRDMRPIGSVDSFKSNLRMFESGLAAEGLADDFQRPRSIDRLMNPGGERDEGIKAIEEDERELQNKRKRLENKKANLISNLKKLPNAMAEDLKSINGDEPFVSKTSESGALSVEYKKKLQAKRFIQDVVNRIRDSYDDLSSNLRPIKPDWKEELER